MCQFNTAQLIKIPKRIGAYLFLYATFLGILFMSFLFSNAQSTIADSCIDKQQSWIHDLLSEHDNTIYGDDYIFYCTGHHGIIWSLIKSDSSGIHLYNGTTRDHTDYADYSPFDTLSFTNDNIRSITWCFDSVADAAQSLTPLKNENYNPIYNELYIINDDKTVFCHNNADYYAGPDSTSFNYKLSKLVFLMYWLAAPSSRPHLPIPCDTLLTD